MTLTTYSNRGAKEFKETYFWALKKSRGMMALLALLLFLAFPLILMVGMSNAGGSTQEPYTAQQWVSSYSEYIKALTSFLVTPLVLLFVLVISVSLFSYLHQKRSVDLFHSLPVGRSSMLLGRLCAAMTVLFAPVLLNYAIVSIIGVCYGIDAKYTFFSLAVSMLWLMLMSTAALAFSIFMAICTGTTFDMVISILGITVAYPLFIFASCTFASLLLPGLSISLSLNSTVLTAFAPFAAAFLPFADRNFAEESAAGGLTGSGGWFLAWWIVLTLIMIIGSVLLYKKRKSECAESNFAFPIPKIMIRFIVTAVAGLGMGLLFQEASSSPSTFFIGIVAGSLAAHIVVEAVYSRGFKQMKRSFAWYGIFVALFIVSYGILATGFFGYDTRLPNADEVESISVTLPNGYSSYSNDLILNNQYQSIATVAPLLKEKTNVSKVLELHKDLISTNRKAAYPYSIQKLQGSADTKIEYHLKNGFVLKRSYSLSDSYNGPKEVQDSYNNLLSQINKMEEYIKTSSILFYIEPEQIKNIDLNIGKEESSTFVLDEAANKELLEALKQDYLDGQINNPNHEYADVPDTISIEYKKDLVPAGKLKEFIGNYSGTVNLNQSYYQLSGSAANTSALIKKYGWDK